MYFYCRTLGLWKTSDYILNNNWSIHFSQSMVLFLRFLSKIFSVIKKRLSCKSMCHLPWMTQVTSWLFSYWNHVWTCVSAGVCVRTPCTSICGVWVSFNKEMEREQQLNSGSTQSMVKWSAASFCPLPRALTAIVNITWRWTLVSWPSSLSVSILLTPAPPALMERLKIAAREGPKLPRDNQKPDSQHTTAQKELMSCPYIFPSTSRCPGNNIQEGVGEVTITIEGVVPTTKRDVAKVPACEGYRGGGRKWIAWIANVLDL